MAAILKNTLGMMFEANRKALEVVDKEVGKPAREDAKKIRDEQEAAVAAQKKELEDIEAGQEKVKKGSRESQALLSARGAKGGRESTLVGVLGSSQAGPAPVKTLLGS